MWRRAAGGAMAYLFFDLIELNGQGDRGGCGFKSPGKIFLAKSRLF